MDDHRIVIDDLIEINRRLCFDIWNLSTVLSTPSGLSPRLIQPVNRKQAPRFSEQEARFLYCSLLNSLGYFYSVETPTQGQYKQKGQVPSTAASDLSLYRFDGSKFLKLVNVEFKAHNCGYESIRKDIEKIMGEGIIGNWFHFLKSVDSHTLRSLCTKFTKSLKDCYQPSRHRGVSLIFAICVSDKRWACIKHFEFKGTSDAFYNWAETLSPPDYKIAKGIIGVSNKNNWSIVP